ncbi:helix-turn-helix domain-containing protein [Pantoea sp. App145]|uniref:helix-turn-helix domain-containing protein n=1 Tax=Pantoea sp. App145 TaxID=3071567 RepID=UPI003A7FB725
MLNKCQQVIDLIQWIEINLDDQINMDDVIKKSGYSRWHIQRIFLEVAGISIADYLRLRRLTKAAIDICKTSEPLLSIALKYNFSSQQSFTRAFKIQFNETPGSYRKAKKIQGHGIFMGHPDLLGEIKDDNFYEKIKFVNIE